MEEALLSWTVRPTWTFWFAATLMGLGVGLHLRERHDHAQRPGDLRPVNRPVCGIGTLPTMLGHEGHKLPRVDHVRLPG